MSSILTPGGAPLDEPVEVMPAAKPMSPNQRAWARFKRHRIGYFSLWIFLFMLVAATGAELLSNDRPIVAKINGQWFAPMFSNPNEKALGGDFGTPTDWKDPFIADLLAKPGNWALITVNPHSATSTDYFDKTLPPGAPSARNWIGTEGNGRDMLARLLYGFRVSIWFALALTFTGTLIGIVAGAIQGYFGGKVDLVLQRFVEIWGSVPELYLLIIFASIFEPSLLLLLILLSLWGWLGLSDYVRAEFLRNRGLEYVKAARAGSEQRPDHLAPRAAQFAHAGDHVFALSHERRDPGADLARLPGPGRAQHDSIAGRAAQARQEPARRLVDHRAHLRAAGADHAAADLHRRRAARCLRYAEILR